jgi:hypothetical protein
LNEVVVVVVLGQFRASGYLVFSSVSTVFLLSWAVWGGLDGPLATVTVPSELGSLNVIDSTSLLATDHWAGTFTETPSLDSVVAPSGADVGDAMGVGVTPGVGLGSSVPTPGPELLAVPRLPRIASAVPHPAIKTVSATTAAMISIHGVLCTGATGAAGA